MSSKESKELPDIVRQSNNERFHCTWKEDNDGYWHHIKRRKNQNRD